MPFVVAWENCNVTINRHVTGFSCISIQARSLLYWFDSKWEKIDKKDKASCAQEPAMFLKSVCKSNTLTSPVSPDFFLDAYRVWIREIHFQSHWNIYKSCNMEPIWTFYLHWIHAGFKKTHPVTVCVWATIRDEKWPKSILSLILFHGF